MDWKEAVEYWNQKVAMDVPPEERAATNTVAMCFTMRTLGYVPYAVVKCYGHELELISYPFPSPQGIGIMVRNNDKRTVDVDLREMLLPLVAVKEGLPIAQKQPAGCVRV
jgi:hypothetical protein